MARISPKLNPSTPNPKISALLAWVLMLLMGVGIIFMVVVGMAGGKKKVTAKRARGGRSNRASEIEEEEEEIDVDWLVERHPAAAEYVAPPEVESEDSEEDVDENDKELNPGFFQGEGTETVFGPGASGGEDDV
ncbi:hypothetical protein RHGRI_008565 [Rhododendron griersonianum]|uniref:Transmembrane protein n=1 Tax=Rhododendron griersonianum TaxID=479676 RepID=A0AAV6L0S9_9ERIC|nr:hypothetical protein RHGRI_008565 [Rhododendron griersonianum]